jgi:hypothetical protein
MTHGGVGPVGSVEDSRTGGVRSSGGGQISGISERGGKLGAAAIASADGSFAKTGSAGVADVRLPHRVLACCTPSLITASPARSNSVFLVQKMRSFNRYET